MGPKRTWHKPTPPVPLPGSRLGRGPITSAVFCFLPSGIIFTVRQATGMRSFEPACKSFRQHNAWAAPTAAVYAACCAFGGVSMSAFECVLPDAKSCRYCCLLLLLPYRCVRSSWWRLRVQLCHMQECHVP